MFKRKILIEHLDSSFSTPTSQPILRRSHHRSRHCNTPPPPMIIVFILVTSPVRAKASHPSLTAFPPVPFRLRTLKNRLPALCFTQNPDTRFAPKILAMICKQVGIKKEDNLQESFWGKSIRKSSYRLSRANKLTLRQL